MSKEATKAAVIEVLRKRRESTFSNGYYNHEMNELKAAEEAIERLIPPEMFEQSQHDKEMIKFSEWVCKEGWKLFREGRNLD